MFLIAPIGTEFIILGMPFLEHTNLDINWKSKTLTPHNVPYPCSSLNPTVIDVPDDPPDSSDLSTSNGKLNTSLKPPLNPSSNQNVKVYLVNQLHIDPEDQVYLFHVYSNLINAGGLPDIYHD